MKESIQLLTI